MGELRISISFPRTILYYYYSSSLWEQRKSVIKRSIKTGLIYEWYAMETIGRVNIGPV